ncbi:MAG TPA: prepilin-type N-terminal cleavage/methylation domain-containing protein [Planctomycetota bacterium]|nr:prepilin-type N-terminal cleavage/methylation domain-containing protein [Planctomycetota bacterium]
MRSSDGFTLVELLLVVALLGIVASTVAVGVTSGDAGARLADARAAVREIDAVARVAAPRDGQLVLSVEEGRFVLRSMPGAEILAERTLPGGMQVALATDDGGQSVVYDAQGQSPNFSARISGERSEVTLKIHGLTGWVEVLP